MAQQNVEVVLTTVDAWNKANADAFMACLHPEDEERAEWSEDRAQVPEAVGLSQ